MLKAAEFRTLGFMMLTLGAIATWGKLILQPHPGQNYPTSLLPKTLHLSHWQRTTTLPLQHSNTSSHYDIVLDTQAYEFHQPSKGLTVQLRYIFNTDGSLGTFQQQWLSSNTSPKKTSTPSGELSDLGYYFLSEFTQETRLDTCLNPQGKNTVTRGQFLDNRLKYDLKPLRLLQWTIGQTQLLDKRCLWVRMILRPWNPRSDQSITTDQLRQALTELQPQLYSILQRPLF